MFGIKENKPTFCEECKIKRYVDIDNSIRQQQIMVCSYTGNTVDEYTLDKDCPIIELKPKELEWVKTYTADCAIIIGDEYEPYPDDVCPDLKCGDVIINKADNIKHLVSAIDERNLNTKHIRIDEGWIIDNEALFNCYVKSDGSPIGRVKGSEGCLR